MWSAARLTVRSRSTPNLSRVWDLNPSPPCRLGLMLCLTALCWKGTFPRQHCEWETLNCCSVVGHLFSLRCSHHHSLSFSLAHTTPPSSSFPHSALCLLVFLCQTWSGCGIKMRLAICSWRSILPTTSFCGTETQAPSCGRRATLRTSSPFLLIPLTPPTWRVGEQHLTQPKLIHGFTFWLSCPHMHVSNLLLDLRFYKLSMEWTSMLLLNISTDIRNAVPPLKRCMAFKCAKHWTVGNT